MRVLDAQVPPSFEIALFGDTHHGSMLCHEKGIDKLIKWAQLSDSHYLIHMGDWIEAIMSDDKRFQWDAEKDPVPLQQRDYVVERYQPVAKKILVGLTGNHEFKLHRFGDIAKDICTGLGVEYGTFTCILRLFCKEQHLFNMFLAHGWGTFRSNAKDFEQMLANKAAAMKKVLRHKAGDCLVMAVGHSHLLMVVPPTKKQFYLGYGKGKPSAHYLVNDPIDTTRYIHPDMRWYANTGSYMRLYADNIISGYAERAGYDPIELGHVLLTVKDKRLVDVDTKVLG